MNLSDVIDRACQEPTLLDALAWVSVWECERVIVEAHKVLNNQTPRNADGSGWSTCFKFLIKETMEQYTIKRLKGE